MFSFEMKDGKAANQYHDLKDIGLLRWQQVQFIKDFSLILGVFILCFSDKLQRVWITRKNEFDNRLAAHIAATKPAFDYWLQNGGTGLES